MEDRTLIDMLCTLYTVNDMAWGHYAFSRDMLRGRIPIESRDGYIKKAIACGQEWAERIQNQTGMTEPNTVSEALELNVTESDQPMTEKGALFARFLPSNNIEIMNHPLETYSALYKKVSDEGKIPPLPNPLQVRSLLLAHEIFHYIEEIHSDEIYTRTEKIRLWKVFRFKNDSTVRAIGEIAAMSFAKSLAKVHYSPFILDILLFFGYNKSAAESIFDDVMKIAFSTHTKDRAET